LLLAEIHDGSEIRRRRAKGTSKKGRKKLSMERSGSSSRSSKKGVKRRKIADILLKL